MKKEHFYYTTIKWEGNTGFGTRTYNEYKRDHVISVKNKSKILCSSDPSFRGDPTKYNPEELLVASLSSCHMLWYLHLCAIEGIIVTAYEDNAEGIMIENKGGSGKFDAVILNPVVTINNPGMIRKAVDLHHQAHEMCFIANSCNFTISHRPVVLVTKEKLS